MVEPPVLTMSTTEFTAPAAGGDVTVAANDTGAERTAEFTMSYPGAADECEFTLVQAADESPSPGGNDFTLKAAYIDEFSYIRRGESRGVDVH